MPRATRGSLDSLTGLHAVTAELVESLTSLSDSLHMSRQTTTTASRRLKSARELVEELRKEEEKPNGEVREESAGQSREGDARTKRGNAEERPIGEEGNEQETGHCDRTVRGSKRRSQSSPQEVFVKKEVFVEEKIAIVDLEIRQRLAGAEVEFGDDVVGFGGRGVVGGAGRSRRGRWRRRRHGSPPRASRPACG